MISQVYVISLVFLHRLFLVGPLTREELESITNNVEQDNSDVNENFLSGDEDFIEYKTEVKDEIKNDKTEVIDLHLPMKEIDDDLGFNSSDDVPLTNLVPG